MKLHSVLRWLFSPPYHHCACLRDEKRAIAERLKHEMRDNEALRRLYNAMQSGMSGKTVGPS